MFNWINGIVNIFSNIIALFSNMSFGEYGSYLGIIIISAIIIFLLKEVSKQ